MVVRKEPIAPADPGLVTYDGGLKLAHAPMWLDATRSVPLSFVSHASAMVKHQRIITSSTTAELLETKLAGADALVSPLGRRFSLGEHYLELLAAGCVAGSAQLCVTSKDATLLYAGCLQTERTAVAEPYELRRAEVLILNCPFDSRPFDFPPRAKTLRSLVAWTEDILAKGAKTPLLLTHNPAVGQELCLVLAHSGIPVRSHRTLARWNRRFARVGFGKSGAKELRTVAKTGEAVVALASTSAASLQRLVPGAVKAVVSGMAVVPREVSRLGADASFAVSAHADAPALRRYVRDVQPKYVYLGPRHSEAFEKSLKRTGVNVFRLGRRRSHSQLDLF